MYLLKINPKREEVWQKTKKGGKTATLWVVSKPRFSFPRHYLSVSCN